MEGWLVQRTQSFHDKFLKLSFPLLDAVVVPLSSLPLPFGFGGLCPHLGPGAVAGEGVHILHHSAV